MFADSHPADTKHCPYVSIRWVRQLHCAARRSSRFSLRSARCCGGGCCLWSNRAEASSSYRACCWYSLFPRYFSLYRKKSKITSRTPPTQTTQTTGQPTVFITGAASGIGLATARLFASKGFYVGVFDLNEEGPISCLYVCWFVWFVVLFVVVLSCDLHCVCGCVDVAFAVIVCIPCSLRWLVLFHSSVSP